MAEINRKLLQLDDTIFALTTGSLPSAVAVIRASGPLAHAFTRQHFQPKGGPWTGERGMFFGVLHDGLGKTVDEIVLLAFVAPSSFTGQDVVEIQCHGSRAVVAEVEALLVAFGMRPAQPGEFSYRAFQNGRLSAEDLENLGDLFVAQEPADLGRIYSRKDGSLETEVAAVRQDLIRLQAILDTAVDFTEEYGTVVSTAKDPLRQAIDRGRVVASRYSAFRDASVVPRLVLAGRPNAGKSSLFNALLCRYRAIVHAKAGTTRDAVEEDIDLGGRRWKLVDTAGVRSTTDDAERCGIELGAEYLHAASMWLLIVDGVQGLGETERELLREFGHKPHWIVWNKKDVAGFQAPATEFQGKSIAVSALTGESVPELAEAMKAEAKPLGDAESPLPTASQSARIQRAVQDLEALSVELDQGLPPEVLGERTRTVLRALETVLGSVSTEEVLDRVFGEFCIGK